jgi:hypothetical protein
LSEILSPIVKVSSADRNSRFGMACRGLPGDGERYSERPMTRSFSGPGLQT